MSSGYAPSSKILDLRIVPFFGAMLLATLHLGQNDIAASYQMLIFYLLLHFSILILN